MYLEIHTYEENLKEKIRVVIDRGSERAVTGRRDGDSHKQAIFVFCCCCCYICILSWVVGT